MFFRSMKGIIALDIDGTLTANAHELESSVIDHLNLLAAEGWKFIFLTGRPFQWGYRTLAPLTFPYALAVQNGALLLDMPSKKILSRKYLTKSILPMMEAIGQENQTDFIIYTGLENEDRCYYRPDHLPQLLLSYLLRRTEYLQEKWEAIQTFSLLPVSLFSSIKFFAKENQAYKLSRCIEKKLLLHAPPNRDPFDSSYFVIQATHADATKGDVLKEFIRLSGIHGPVIAAGDDYNDHSMLEAADVKIVMANAPAEILKIADIVAPSAKEKGIIRGLKEALALIHKKKD